MVCPIHTYAYIFISIVIDDISLIELRVIKFPFVCHKMETEVSDLLCKFLFGYLNDIRTTILWLTKSFMYLPTTCPPTIDSWYELLKCNCAGGGRYLNRITYPARVNSKAAEEEVSQAGESRKQTDQHKIKRHSWRLLLGNNSIYLFALLLRNWLWLNDCELWRWSWSGEEEIVKENQKFGMLILS